MFYAALENGLELALQENHQSRMVSIQFHVNVGSMHESASQRGLAHVLEHMIFKGSTDLVAGELAQKIEVFGGDVNAYTTFDRTVYIARFVSDHLEEALKALLNSILNPSVDAGELKKEQEVIAEEIKMGVDSPASKLGYELFRICYEGTEVGRPVIGDIDAVRGFGRQDLLDFHEKWYTPNNMKVIVVGDFNTELVLTQLKDSFGQISKKALSKPLPISHSFDKGKIGVSVLREDQQNYRFEIALPCPEIDSFDAHLLDMAAFALGGGESSRLAQRLKFGENKVTHISCSTYTPSFPGLFTITGYTDKENFTDVIESVGRQLKLILTSEPVTADEIKRVISILRAEKIYLDEQIDGLASSLGMSLQTEYKVHFNKVYLQMIESAEPQLVSHIVGKWLDLSSAKIAALVPKDSKLTADAISGAFERGIVGYRDSVDLFHSLGAADRGKDDVPQSHFFELENGIKVVYQLTSQTRQFYLGACTHGGIRLENEGDSGIHNLLSGSLCEESENYPYKDILSLVEGGAASLAGFSGKDSFGLNLHCLSTQTHQLLPIFFECLLEPRFCKKRFASLVGETKETIIFHEDSPSSVVMREFAKHMFPSGHPYARPTYGSLETLEAFQLANLEDTHKSLLKRSDWVLSCVGSLAKEEVQRILNQGLGGQALGLDRLKLTVPDGRVDALPRRNHIKMQKEQSHVVVGFRGLDWRSSMRPALDVLMAVLGGQGGRLFVSLREEKALAYSVSPILSYGVMDGIVGGYIACSNQKVDYATEALCAQFDQIACGGPTLNEIERAKNHLVGQHELDNQSPETQGMSMGLMELYGVGHRDFLAYPDKVLNVSVDDVINVARSVFKSEARLCVSVGG